MRSLGWFEETAGSDHESALVMNEVARLARHGREVLPFRRHLNCPHFPLFHADYTTPPSGFSQPPPCQNAGPNPSMPVYRESPFSRSGRDHPAPSWRGREVVMQPYRSPMPAPSLFSARVYRVVIFSCSKPCQQALEISRGMTKGHRFSWCGARLCAKRQPQRVDT